MAAPLFEPMSGANRLTAIWPMGNKKSVYMKKADFFSFFTVFAPACLGVARLFPFLYYPFLRLWDRTFVQTYPLYVAICWIQESSLSCLFYSACCAIVG